METEINFKTIRQTAKETGIAEFRIRQWAKTGKLPGFMAGTRFYVNVPQLREQLERGTVSG